MKKNRLFWMATAVAVACLGAPPSMAQAGTPGAVTPPSMAQALATPGAVPPPPNMVAWWPLDETSSPANDLAGVNNTGIWMNGPTAPQGKVARALCFDGVDDYVEVQDHSELNFGTGDFSIDAWVKRDLASSPTPPSVIVDKRDPGDIGYSLAVSYGRLAFRMNTVNYLTTTSPVPADDQWHHVAVTVNRVTNVVQFYGDGILLNTLPFTSPPGNLNNTNSFWIGKGQLSGNRPWFGCIDELELFKRALDPSEVKSIWVADNLGKCKGVLPAPPDMKAWWPLDEITGMVVNDIAGSVFDNGTPLPAPIGGVGGPASVPAVVGTGLNFPAGISPTPGPNVYVEVPSGSEVNFGTGDFAIDAWIKLGPVADNIYPIVDKLDFSVPGIDKGYALFVQGGQLLLRLGPDDFGGLVAAVSNFASPMTLGPWYHVAVTVKRGPSKPQVTFYVNAVQYGPVPTAGPNMSAANNIASTTPLWIGGNSRLASGGAIVSRGEITIDELEFFHRELTPLEVNSIWKADSYGKCCCDCPHQGDINGDGVIDVFDVIGVIDIAFLGALDPQDPCCPITRGDVNGDRVTDVFDVIYLIEYVFIGGPNPFDPCGP